jgi:hypothetical protein
VYLIFNLSHPALRDVRVRRAVAQALDRGAIVRHLLLGKATLATGLLPPGHWAYDAEARRFDHDPAAAQRLLDEAGYPDPGGGRPRLLLRYAAPQGEISLQQAAVIQEDLARIGIAVEVRSSEWATFYDDLRSGRFEMAVSNWTDIGDPDIFRLRFASSETPPAGLNRGGYANPRADRFIEAGARETDRDRRRADYAGLQVLLAEDLPCVWLWHKDVRAASGPRLRGFTLTSGADFRPLWRARVATTSASGEAASEGRLEGGGGDGARADEMRRIPGQVDDRGGAPPAGRSGVDDQIDAVAETLFHLAGGARRRLAAAVGAGGDDRRPEGARQSGGDGMGRHAHADGTPAAEEPRRQVGRGLQDERQRSGPEGFHQAAGPLRGDGKGCDGGGIGGEQRQRQAIGPSLGRVDRLDRGGRPRVARQTVEGFGRICDQAAGAQHLGGAAENLRRGSLGIDPHRLRHRAVPPHAPSTEAGATIAQGVAA